MRRLAVLLLATALCSGMAFGAATPLAFDIASGPLQAALQRFSDQTGLQILYDPALLQGRLTHGLKGTLLPEQALATLLASTDITFSFTASDAVALFRKSAPAAASAPRISEQPVSLRMVTISANREFADRYNSRASFTATKVDESPLLVPLASESLTQAILRDRQVGRLEDALEYVSAAEVAPNGQSALGFILRGFPTYQYYLDGVRVSPDLHHDGFRDMANIERIEVVKGPASLLYGRTEPGGAINLITKQPLEEPRFALEQQTGSFGRRRTELDAGGPVEEAPQLLYRLNVAHEDQGSFRGIPNRRLFMAPAVRWNLSAATSATMYAEYLDSRDRHDSGLPVIGEKLPPVPITRSLETGSEVHTLDWRVGLKGSHAFSNGWTVRLHADGRWTQSPRSAGLAISDDGLSPSTCSASACPVQRELVIEPVSRGHTYFVSLDAHGDVSFWRTRHSLLAGVDEFLSLGYTEITTQSDPSLATDLFNPRSYEKPLTPLESLGRTARNRVAERWTGAYIQDQIQLLDSLYFLVGARYDRVIEEVDNTVFEPETFPDFIPFASGRTPVKALKGRAGLLWHPLPSLSFYANYSQNFGVTAGLYASGSSTNNITFVPPEIAYEEEAGVKYASADGRLSATLAFFNLSKAIISSPILEPAIDNSSLYQVMNGARTRGLEVELHGEPLRGLQLLASYAYLDSRIDNDPGFFPQGRPKDYELAGATGDRLAGVPLHGGSLWATYHLWGSGSQGLRLGAGAVVRGTRPGDNINDYWLPGFARIDALAAFGWRAAGTNFSVQLNLDNLLNKRYYESLSGTRTVLPGPSRSWIATVGVEF